VEERKAPSSSASPPRKPLDFALRRLARRGHSRGELSAKMARAGYRDEEIQSTLAFLDSRGYLDDSGFARDVARASSERKLWGPARIERRLRELKLTENDIAGALDEVFPEGEEVAAKRAFERFLRVSRRKKTDAEAERARAYRHLVGRGFSPAIARRVVSTFEFEDTL
jgi:regulatory protein